MTTKHNRYRPTELKRGGYTLNHQPQVLARDLCAEQILTNPGAKCMGYRLTEQQSAELMPGTISRRWVYDFLVYAPNSPATNSRAFHTLEALTTWREAYDVAIDRDPEPGDRFELTFPSAANFQPLTGLGGIWVVSVFPDSETHQRESGPYTNFADAAAEVERLDPMFQRWLRLQAEDVPDDPYTMPCYDPACGLWYRHCGDHRPTAA